VSRDRSNAKGQLDPIADEDEGSEVTVRLPVSRAPVSQRRAIPTLRVVAGRDMLKFVALAPGEQILIGRDERAQLRLTDLAVSKRHAKVSCREDHYIEVTDMDSTNGTTVNGKRIDISELQTGDHLEIGGVSLRLDMLSLDELGHLGRVVQRLESSNRDPLTGLLTRTYLDEELPELVKQCTRAGVPISAAFMDVDHFKSINDGYNHLVGDEVLAAISRLVMVGVRDADPVVRYGGEEVLLLLPGSSNAVAVDVADRIRRTVAGHDWDRTAPALRVTVSAGISERKPDEPIKDWILRADEAMLKAKRAGRNRVFSAP
jgi:diguanylate cyclase (GGDEF)-like protein